MKRFKLAVVIILAAAVLAGCALQGDGATDANVPDINPKAEAAGKDTSDVTLYFSYRGENHLAGETRSVDVPVSDTLEAAVVRALIGGPSADRDELTGLFWQGVELIDVDTKADYIFITLSEDFIESPPGGQLYLDGITPTEQKRLAIYSIVNTLTQMGKYSRVQIQVDRADGVGRQRVTLAEAGFSDNTNAYLEPLGYFSDVILTPQNTLAQALQSFARKDWTRLYTFTASYSHDLSPKPSLGDFSDALAAKGNVLERFLITDSMVSYDGQSVVVMLDYTIKRREGDTVSRENIPVVLVREEDIWKLTYTSLVDVLINV